MGQITQPFQPGIFLSATDRLLSSNAAAGLSPLTSHVIIFGENAGLNLSGTRTNVILLGQRAGAASGADDVTVIGGLSGDGGLTQVNGMNSTIIIGVRSIRKAITRGTTFAGTNGILVIGNDVMTNITGAAGNSLVIGNRILNGYTSGSGTIESNLIIGHDINPLTVGDFSGCNFNTVIGIGASKNRSLGGLTSNIFIGSLVMTGGQAPAGNTTGNTVIGNSAGCGSNITLFQNNVIIGQSAQLLGVSTTTVAIGNNVTSASGGNVSAVLVGNAVSAPFGTGNILIGGKVNITGNGNGVIVIGFEQGTNVAIAGFDGLFCVGKDNATAGLRGHMFYGNMMTGNLIVGKSDASNRDFAGVGATNILKMLNGTAGNANPIGGGYFYLTAGVLKYMRTDGQDSILSPAAGVLAETVTPLTNGAAANAGTLANAPAIGNPTKWIPINDAGTVRYIPAW